MAVCFRNAGEKPAKQASARLPGQHHRGRQVSVARIKRSEIRDLSSGGDAAPAFRFAPCGLRSHQRLREIRHQIVRMLYPDGEADRRVTHADARAQVGGHARMGRRAGMAGKRLGTAEAQTPRDNSAATALRNGGRDWFTVFQT